MKLLRIEPEVVEDDLHWAKLKNAGFDMNRPIKQHKPNWPDSEGRLYYRFTQHEPEDGEGDIPKDQQLWSTESKENGSGILPVEYKVLISRPEVKIKSDGGIFLPEQTVEKEKMRRVIGLLVAIGGNAFEDWKPPIPRVGQRVRIAKYVGEFFEGLDGKPYQLCSDKDISSIVSEEWEEKYYPHGQSDFAGDGEFAHLRTQQDPEEEFEKFKEKNKPGADRIRVFMGGGN